MSVQRGGKTLRHGGLAPLGSLALALAFAQACSGGNGPAATLTITGPKDGVKLNRADDLDDQKDGVQFEVVVGATNAEGATVSLVPLDGTLAQSATAPIQGGSARVGFTIANDVKLAAEAKLADGTTVRSAPVQLYFDPATKACRFTSPADGQTLTAANDASPADGFQTDLRVRCAGVALGSPVTLTVNGGKQAQVPLGAGGQALFGGVELAEGDNLLSAVALPSAAEKISTDAKVTVSTGGCRLVLNPATGTTFNARGEGGADHVADSSPGAPMDATLLVDTGAECQGDTITLLRGTTTLATQQATPPATRFTVQLADGTADLRAVASGAKKGASPLVHYTVDAVVPTAQLVFPKGGEAFDDRSDRSSDPGLQIPVRGSFLGLDKGSAFEVVLDAGTPSESVLTQTLTDPAGAFDLLVTVPNGKHTLVVRGKRPSGTTVQTEGISFTANYLAATLAIQQPGDGAHLGLARDADPLLPGYQIAFKLVATNLPGAKGQVTCGGDPASITIGQDGTASATVTVSAPQCGANRVSCQAQVTSSTGSVFDAKAVTLSVDQTPPEVTVLAPAPGEILSTNVLTVEATTGCPGEVQSAQLLRGADVLAGPLAVTQNAISFADVLLPGGETQLTVRVSDEAGNETDQTVTVYVDSDTPQVVFVDPAPQATAVFGATDDQHGDLTDGFQRTIQIAVPNELVGTLVELRVGNRAPFSARTSDVNGQKIAVFDGVSLPEGDSTLRACATDEAGSSACVVQAVRVSTGRPLCTIATPNDGSALGHRDDLDSTQDGVQADVVVDTDLPSGQSVSLSLTGPAGATSATGVSDGQGHVRFSRVSFAAEGSYVLAATCQPADGPATSALPNQVAVDFTAPSFDVIDPVEDQIFNLASADRGAAAGFQLDVKVKAQESSPGLVAHLTVSCGQGPHDEPPLALNTLSEATFRAVSVPDLADCDLSVTVEDGAGNVSAPLVRHVRIDRVAPTVTITQPADGLLLGQASDADKTTSAFELALVTADVDGVSQTGSVQLTAHGTAVAGGNLQGARASWSMVALAEGPNDLVVTATDDAGNKTSALHRITVDTRSPVVTITNFVSGQLVGLSYDTNRTTAGIQVNVPLLGEKLSNGTVVRICSPQGTGTQACQTGSGKVLAQATLGGGQAVVPGVTLPEGAISVYAEAVDVAGNTAQSAALQLTVDATPPVVEQLQLVTVGAGGSETVQDLSGGTVVLGSAADGSPTQAGLQVRLKARLSGVETGKNLRASFVDTNPAPGTILGSQLIAADGTVSLDVTLPEGGHRIHVVAQDAAGNTTSTPDAPFPGQTPQALSFAVDLTPPQISLLAPTPGVLLAKDDKDAATPGLQLDVTVDSDAGAGRQVQLKLDGQPLAQLTLPTTGRQATARVTLPEGAHTLTAQVADGAGNVATSASVAVTVDSVAPIVSVTQPTEGQTLATDADLVQPGFQADVQLSYSQVEAGRPLVLVSSAVGILQQTTTDASGHSVLRVTMGNGTQQLSAQATDASGNVTTSTPVSITVDAGAPFVRFVSTQSPILFGIASDKQPGGDCQVDVAALCDTNGATAELLVNGTPLPSVTVAQGKATFPDVTIGVGQSVTLQLRATDSLNRTGYSPSRQASCDLVAPTAAFADPQGASSVTYVAYGNPGAVTGVRVDKLPSTDLEADFTVTVGGADGGSVALVSDKDGQVASQPVAAGVTSVTFTSAVLKTPGHHTLTAVATDPAGNTSSSTAVPAQAAAQLQLTVDVRAPAAVVPVPTALDGRKTSTQLSFQAPADDGAMGQTVAGYQVRYALSPIATEDDWSHAAAVSAKAGTLAAPGSVQQLVVDGLAFERIYHFAVRAQDAVGNLAPLGSSAALSYMLNRTSYPAATAGATSTFVRMVAADLDKDGKTDLVFSNATYASSQGQVVILYGTSQGGTPQRVELQGTHDASGAVLASKFGSSLAVGDVNGDGLPDLVVGAYGEPLDPASPSTNDGALFVYLGRVQGAGAQRLTASSTPDSRIYGAPSSFFGQQVVVAGDLNADGVADLVAGSPSELGGHGKVYVIAGRPTWPAQVMTADSLAALTTSFATTNNGAAGLGVRVAALGDLDGDGAVDFAASAANGTMGTSDTRPRPVFVVSGKLARGAKAIETVATAVYPTSFNYLSQFGLALAAGDVTGDGKADLLVGDPSASWSQIALFSGADLAGLLPASEQTGLGTQTAPIRETLRLPAGDSRRFGGTIFLLPDLNGDGRLDVAAGFNASQGALNELRVWFGRSKSGWGDADVTLLGASTQTNFGVAAAGGLFSGQGVNDIAALDLSGNLTVLSGPSVP